MRNKLSREEKLFIRDFGMNLRALREERNLSQTKLEAIAGLSKNQVWRIENGEVNTTISNLKLLAKALNIDIAQLFEFRD
ncbi:helix-turn-helix domain protein [Allomuricauda ruestringensis DSM 13258]|uniref:Helix-turn-helix domain protein n=1 Tax=Allomuricauda ruestringensis (strain DSM 13258 / CIP 107369 / LMG 19739 / B1) TaxID=886377 RepID=G2PKW8_ALLRU|nr:helix-turn-helix transcriptional regulator [Allomuricauda ruestringensis]AEM69947.1 helix-turn-helix domain protein [Allomuricauda ruestringensis DSM 13258]